MTARLATAILLTLAAAACGGDGVVSDPPPPGGAPTLTALQSSVFTPSCAVPGCHAQPSPQQGMDLSAGQTWSYTVGVDVAELAGYVRVAPGNSTDSYLYMKITADPRIVGEQMPLGGSLTAAQIAAVRAWIDAGALDN
jgi:hypothetical protein